MTLIDLKPCPFDCGATKEGKHPEIGQSNSTFAFHVYCSWCGVEGEAHEIEQDAITAWNARAQQQEPLAWLDSPEAREKASSKIKPEIFNSTEWYIGLDEYKIYDVVIQIIKQLAVKQ